VITVVHWLKHIIIVQKLTSVVEFWALVDHHCLSSLPEVFFIARRFFHHLEMRVLGHNNDAAKRYTEHEAKLFSLQKLTIQAVTELCKSPVSYWWPTLLLFQRILWASETLFWQSLGIPMITLFIYWTLAIQLSIYLVKRLVYATLVYATLLSWVYPGSYCALIGTSHKLPPPLYRQPLNKVWVRAVGCKQSARVSTRSE